MLDVPEALRSHFGKKRFVKSLQTESLSEAERRVLPVIAGWKAEIEAAKTGSPAPLRDLSLIALEWSRDYVGTDDPELRSIYDDVLEEKVEEIAQRDEAKAQTFRKVVKGETIPTDHFCERWITNISDTAKSKQMKKTDIRRLTKAFPYTHQITRPSVREWVEKLQTEENLKPATVQRTISACRGYWSYLQRIGEIGEDNRPFGGVSPEREKKTKAYREAERKAFKTDEVVGLLNAAIEKGDTLLAHLIWLGMWTGCRIEELCALRTSDVEQDRFTIPDAKSKAGVRVVPIHSMLSEVMARLTQTSIDGYVLSGLTFNTFGHRSNAVGKRFGYLKKKLGFGPQHVFHSIRKTVATELENAGVPESIAADIIGHEKKTMTYGLYSAGAHFPVRRDCLEKVQYPIDRTPAVLLA